MSALGLSPRGRVGHWSLVLVGIVPPEVFDYLRVHASHLPHGLLVHIPLFREVDNDLIDGPPGVLQPRDSHGLIGRLGSILGGAIGGIGLMNLRIGEGPLIIRAPLASSLFVLHWCILP